MQQHFLRSDPALLLYFQHGRQQVHSLGIISLVGFAGEVEAEVLVAAVYFVIVAAGEEEAVSEQHVEDDTQGEDVTPHVDALITLHPNDFRCNVAGSATAVEEVGLFLTDGCQSQIHYDWLEGVPTCEHDVLQFDVPVHHSHSVHVAQALPHPHHHLLHLPCTQSLAGIDAFQEGTSLEQVSDQVDGVVGLVDTVHSQYIVMFHGSKQRNFVESSLCPLRLRLQEAPQEDLRRHHPSVTHALHPVDGGGAASPYLAQHPKLLVETYPVEELGESEQPEVQEGGVLQVDARALLLVVDESDATAN